MDIAIIPAYNPDIKLIELIDDLSAKKLEKIIVINDGSDIQSLKIFEDIRDRVIVLTHDINKGKGAAIKTALKYIANLTEVQGIVVLDADGQHRPEDAVRLLNQLHTGNSDFVLGVRNFTGKIPLRSLFGNTVTKYVFRLCSGKWISDTQTGLRAFSKSMVSKLIQVQGDRYEYEMNVLLTCAKDRVRITEVPIATIYLDDSNSCSHFRTIRDSARIYGNLLLFSGASFLSFLVDYLIFFPLVWVFGTAGLVSGTALICGNIAARFVSAAFNYYLNSTFVFKDKENRKNSISGYAILACGILTLNTVILYSLHHILGINEAIAKLVTELLLFIISFTVQKFIIFNKIANKAGAHI